MAHRHAHHHQAAITAVALLREALTLAVHLDVTAPRRWAVAVGRLRRPVVTVVPVLDVAVAAATTPTDLGLTRDHGARAEAGVGRFLPGRCRGVHRQGEAAAGVPGAAVVSGEEDLIGIALRRLEVEAGAALVGVEGEARATVATAATVRGVGAGAGDGIGVKGRA